MASYEIQNNRTYRINDDGEREMLANFHATIVKETRIVDGRSTETVLTVSAIAPNPDDEENPFSFPETDVPAANFAGLQWVMSSWGVRAIIQPGSSIKEDLRTAIQLMSKPEVRVIYKHIGWTDIGKEPAYLHSGGAIKKNGNDPSVTVRLPQELANYDLSINGDSDVVTAIRATLSLLRLTEPEVTWPLLAATFAPLFGPVDFGMHVTGRTGTFKSELMSLFQSHYGDKMDARHLPGSWSSTANALEAQSYYAKNAPFVIDDFVPIGSSWQIRAYQTTADKIVRSQGNQSGRARLTDTSNLQTTMYPRGIILSTGEDTPEGHSVRARMLIIELSPGDISPDNLTKAQRNRPLYKETTAALVQWLCNNETDLAPRAKEIRDKNLEIGHTRTPAMLGNLAAVAEQFILWCREMSAITANKATDLKREAVNSIMKQGNNQAQYLEASDPCDLFAGAIRNILGAGLGHLRTINGGIPLKPEILGWTSETSLGDLPTYKSKGPCIGWVCWHSDELFIDVTAGYNTIRKVAGNELSMTKQTMLKRLKDAGNLTRTDEARQRNTVRITAEGHPRQVLSLCLSTILDMQEKPQDEQSDPTPPDGENWDNDPVD